MARTHYPARRAAEQRFPFRVDIPVPAGGLGGRLNEMAAWCREHFTGGWDHHGRTDPTSLDTRGIATGVMRFYFLTEADADLFRQRWHS